ncbi:MAG: serine protease [Bacteroidetes bacterium CG_4_10_14_3_um_filter_31_20]|nr:S46 family peptidase [Bacteroidota bacterium]PIY02974.1 MAG: serine protease [Bacteroidetes bacterium CG_4_10_14_3_um_filter_31_20]
MSKRIIVLFVAIFVAFTSTVKADEGMWILSLIHKNYEDMKKQGFKLTANDVYNINKASLKDAICGLSNERFPMGFFCSAEIVSGQGLLLTNHHCGYESIQNHSSVEHDYLSDGFWAFSKDQELSNDDMCASFLVRIDDVSDRVLKDVTEELSYDKRQTLINKAIKEIVKESKKDNSYNVEVKDMFAGNQYFLFVFETFKDVRLVGAPPSSIGKFGGDTDNWMWPRHTGDFSMFRVYCAPDGKPAKYSKDNIPYQPKEFLPVSIKGVDKGDFAMVMGFPGQTERYMTSFGVKEKIDILNPAAIKIRTKKLDLMKKDMDASNKVRIQYASKYAQTANYWKYFIGESKGLRKLNIIEQKQELEKQFTDWLNASPDRQKLYGTVLSSIEKNYTENKEKSLGYQYVIEGLFQGGEIIAFPLQSMQLYRALSAEKPDAATIKTFTDNLREAGKNYFKDYNASTDKKIFAALLKIYYEDVPQVYQLEIFSTVQKKYKGDFARYAEDVFKKSIFADETRFSAFLDNPSKKALDNDMAFVVSQQALQQYFSLGNSASDEFENATRLFEKGIMEMQAGKLFYPDANSTIRLTYGTVGDYKPADAVQYHFYTTLSGIMEKEDSTNDEFVVPAKLKELYNKKDFGQYASPNNDLRICFTTNNDITGGNSGSAVINGNGELIGIAFDGNWEAMSGNIAFENTLQKCINVDIRYVLFIIDKYAGAHNLINEMKLVN